MHRKFLAYFGVLVFLLMLSTGLFNYLVDPYNIWHAYRRIGFNQFPIKAEDMDRLIKPIEMTRIKPHTVFIGHSQVVWCIEPSTYTGLTGNSAYNFAMLGSGIYEMRRCLEHAIASDDELKEVYLCVNFDMFAANKNHRIGRKKGDFDEEQIGKSYITGQNIEKTIFSWKAIEDSLETVRENNKNRYDFPYYTMGGRWHDKVIEHYFHRRQWGFNASLLVMARLDYYYEDMQFDEELFDELKKCLEMCREHNIKLVVYTIPMHARSLELYSPSWNLFEEWERRLANMTPFMDFIGYNEITMSVADNGVWTNRTNPYFWDTHHAKVVVGDMIIKRILCIGGISSDFGVMVTPENVEQHLTQLRQAHEVWEKNHPESVEEVRYYTGFSSLVPQFISGKVPQYGSSLVQIDQGTKDDIFHAVLPSNGHLEFGGSSMTLGDMPFTSYVMLIGQNDKRYYALAEPKDSPTTADFMRSHKYDHRGIYLNASLRSVEPGTYELYVLEVAKDGRVFQSDVLGQVTVNAE